MGRRGDRQGRTLRPPHPPPGRALRRPAAACGDRPRAGHATDGDVRRRAHRQPRLHHQRGDPGAAARGRRELRTDHRDGHPRRARLGDGRPHPVPGRRPDRARPGPRQRAGRADGHGGGVRAVILVALRGLWGRKTRAVLTAISIVLGTAMITGTFVVRDQITGAFNEIFQTGLEKTDVLLSKKTAFSSDNGAQAGPLQASLIDQVAKVPGVAKAEGQVQALGALVVGGKYAGSTTGAPSLALSTLSDTFNPYTYSHGRGPQSSGEVVVNSKLADDKHLHIGQHVELATDVGLKPVTI